MKKTNLIAGIWGRVSTEDQVRDESLDVHIERSQRHCDDRGWPVAEVYRLDGISGKSVINHPETKRMIYDVESGRINVLVFSSLSRLGRNSIELQQIERIFSKAGCYLVSLREHFDTSTPAGADYFRMLCSRAQYEREELSVRVQSGIIMRSKMGKIWGRAPFGYVKDHAAKTLVPDPVEAPIRALAYDLFIEHKNLKKTCRLLNERGFLTREGNPFTHAYLKYLIADTTAKGLYIANRHNGDRSLKPAEQWIEIPIQPIISADKWDYAQIILSHLKSERAFSANQAQHPYSGIVKCSGCGGGLGFRHISQPGRNEQPRYRCNHEGCKAKVSILAVDLDALTAQAIEGVTLKNLPADALISHTENQSAAFLAQAESELAKLSRAKAKLLTAYEADAITVDDLKLRMAPINTRAQNLSSEIERLKYELQSPGSQSQKELFKALENRQIKWLDLLDDEKRDLLRLITRSIVLKRGRLEIEFNELPDSIMVNPATVGDNRAHCAIPISSRVSLSLTRPDNVNHQAIAANLKAYRKQNKITLRSLSALSGLTRNTISRIEKRQPFNIDTLHKLEQAIGQSLSTLLLICHTVLLSAVLKTGHGINCTN